MSDLIPCFGVTGILAIVFGFLAFMRYMNYKETLALAEKGITRPEKKDGKGYLRWGVILTSVGVALSLGLYTVGFFSGSSYPLQLGPWMLGGFVPLFLGIGLILLHYLSEKE